MSALLSACGFIDRGYRSVFSLCIRFMRRTITAALDRLLLNMN